MVIIISFLIVLPVYYGWVVLRNKKIAGILEIECDPVRFIEKCNKANMLYPDISKAVAYMCLGNYEDSLSLLLDSEMPKKPKKLFKLAYHSLLMGYYLETGDLKKAGDEYEDDIKNLRKGLLISGTTLGVDLLVLEYHYKLSTTSDTAKYYLEQVKYLFDINSKLLTKRQKVAIWYIEAELFEKIDDTVNAASMYAKVAKNGNKLWIAESSREKLKKLEISTRPEQEAR